MNKDTEFTVVITSYARPDKLRACLQSVIEADAENLVISAVDPGHKNGLEAIIKKFYSEHGADLDVQYVLSPVDYGCNETWLRGVYAAKTPFVLVLHDDDLLVPGACATIREQLSAHGHNVPGFVTWRGAEKNLEDEEEPLRHNPMFEKLSTGVYSSAHIHEYLMRDGYGPISPVISLWDREVAIAALNEVSNHQCDKVFFAERGTMNLGNEFLTYVRHAQRFPTWMFIDKVLTHYGAWEGSESKIAAKSAGKNWVAAACDAVRDRVRQGANTSPVLKPKLLHVYNPFPTAGPREMFAQSTWKAHHQGPMLPVPVRTEDLPRSSGRVFNGSKRDVPFLKDVMEVAYGIGVDTDVLVFTNMDTCLTEDCSRRLMDHFSDPGKDAAFVWRRNFRPPMPGVPADVRRGWLDGGVDLIAIRRRAWPSYCTEFPDMVIGYSEWDTVMRWLIEYREREGFCFNDLVYHVTHEPNWRVPTGVEVNPAVYSTDPEQLYNMRCQADFFKRHNTTPEYDLSRCTTG